MPSAVGKIQYFRRSRKINQTDSGFFWAAEMFRLMDLDKFYNMSISQWTKESVITNRFDICVMIFGGTVGRV